MCIETTCPRPTRLFVAAHAITPAEIRMVETFHDGRGSIRVMADRTAQRTRRMPIGGILPGHARISMAARALPFSEKPVLETTHEARRPVAGVTFRAGDRSRNVRENAPDPGCGLLVAFYAISRTIRRMIEPLNHAGRPSRFMAR